MKTKTQPISGETVSRATAREDRFFDRAQAALPRGAVLISARGIFTAGCNQASFTYRYFGKVFTTTLKTEGGNRA